MKVLGTNLDNRELDSNAINNLKIDSKLLMECAGLKACLYLKEHYDLSNCLILCGKGNNGGDALVIARYALLDKNNVSIYVVDEIKSDLTKEHLNTCLNLNAKIVTKIEDKNYSLVIDGILGSGISSSANKDLEKLFIKVNNTYDRTKVIALDQCSGYSDNLCVNSPHINSDCIINFGLDKISNYHPSFSDSNISIIDVNPGFDLSNVNTNNKLWDFSDIKIKPLSSRDYKNSRKSALCFVGSKKYSGALRLAIRGLYRSGIGLVTCYTDPRILSLVGENHPSLILDDINDYDFSSNYDVMLIGCGCDNLISKELLEKLLDLDIPTVIDASALKIFSEIKVKPRKSKIVITPHLGEIRSFGIDNVNKLSSVELKEKLIEISKKYFCDILLKSNVNWIIANNELNIVASNNPSMGVAGSGDILSSIVSTFLAQEIPNYLVMANLVHQKAGSYCEGYFPSEDILDNISKVIKEGSI